MRLTVLLSLLLFTIYLVSETSGNALANQLISRLRSSSVSAARKFSAINRLKSVISNSRSRASGKQGVPQCVHRGKRHSYSPSTHPVKKCCAQHLPHSTQAKYRSTTYRCQKSRRSYYRKRCALVFRCRRSRTTYYNGVCYRRQLYYVQGPHQCCKPDKLICCDGKFYWSKQTFVIAGLTIKTEDACLTPQELHTILCALIPDFPNC